MIPAYQVVRGGRLLDTERRSADHADIIIAGDTIVEVGPPGIDAPDDAVLIDASDRLIMPGLVNAHTHGNNSFSKGLGDRWSLALLQNANPWMGGRFTLEDKYNAALLNAAEMVLKGCTAAYDMYAEFPRPSLEGLSTVGQAYSDVGVRVVLAPSMGDSTFYEAVPGLLDALPQSHRDIVEKMRAAPYEDHVAACTTLLRDWPFDRGRVRPALGPSVPLSCSDAFIRSCTRLAHDYDVGIQMHLAEAEFQAVSGMKRYGTSLVRHLDRLDLLGPHFTGAHCIWLDNDDLQIMRDRGASVAHNPGSNLRLGSGVAPARQMVDLGLTIGIGTDGSCCADSQNMFEAMRMAALVSRLVSRDPDSWLGSWEVLSLGTDGAAQVLGLDAKIGRLQPGYQADIVFLDLTNVNYVPLNDVANQVVNCEDSSAVDSVMIGGRTVVANRRLMSINYDKLRQDVQAAADRLRNENAATREQMTAISTFVSRHCIGLVDEGYHVHRHLAGPIANKPAEF